MYIILTIYFCTALDLLQTAIEKAGFTEKVVVGMDVAASEFHHEGKYDLDFKSPPDSQRHISAEELADIYQSFVNNYPGRHGFATLNFSSQINFIYEALYNSKVCLFLNKLHCHLLNFSGFCRTSDMNKIYRI